MSQFILTIQLLHDAAYFDDLAFQRVAKINQLKYRSFDIARLGLDRARHSWAEKLQSERYSGSRPQDDFARHIIGELCYQLIYHAPFIELQRPDTQPRDAALAKRIDFVSSCADAYFATDFSLEVMRRCLPMKLVMLPKTPFSILEDACLEITRRPMQARHVVELTGYTTLFAALPDPSQR